MTQIRRGNYVFVTWVCDHGPRHVHVFRDRKCVLKWDLEAWARIEGVALPRIVALIRELVDGGRL